MSHFRLLLPVLAAFLLASAGCADRNAALPDVPQQAAEASLDDYDDFDDAAVSDPLEGWNRFWFGVNDAVWTKAVKPVYNGYAAVVPETVRSGLSNFRKNLGAPVRFVNFLLQGEFAEAGVEFDRFLINTALSLGFADCAAVSEPNYPYEAETGNFGYTLGRWGFAAGPYFTIPLLGPSTVRNAVGFAADSMAAPENYLVGWPVRVPAKAVLGLNDFGGVIKAYEQLTGSAVDPYVSVRNAYMANVRP